MGDNIFKDDLTRREAMKAALKGAAYAAPVVLAATVPGLVSAATPAPTAPPRIAVTATQSNPTANSITFTVTVSVTNTGFPNATFGASVRPGNAADVGDSHIRLANFQTDASGSGSTTGTVSYSPTSGGLANTLNVLSGPRDALGQQFIPNNRPFFNLTLTNQGDVFQGTAAPA